MTDVVLDLGDGTSCTVNLLGATVTSWKVGGSEQLFVSKNAVFDGKTPISGGIPVVFPKFSHWEGKPFHGFAKECLWKVETPPTKSEDGDVKAVLNLADSEWTRQYWNYAFSLTLEVNLSRSQLTLNISIHNPCPEQSFAFELLLHTYLLLQDVTKCEITGFKGCSFLDNTQNLQEFTQETDVITIRKHIDNIYRDTANEHVISQASEGKCIKLSKTNYPDTVVWNPWEDAESRIFFCIEAGHVSKPVLLNPGHVFKASQTLCIA
ncbi:hypothetical protein GE061_001953 [Apolygus lucorum]|uniref:glucose-6-phosphate 1-epimerase n=1 Tax=Apolygus lucorum TaxID=248454 RepID=A0A8S9X5L6_APOLU|nr:hypothetical protein GE061_001953 [Apolygus lucorum]